MHKLLRFVKSTLKNQAPRLSKLFGITLLTRHQTRASLALAASEVVHHQGEVLTLPRLTCRSTTQDKQLFSEETLRTASGYVWRLENRAGQVKQLPSGSLLLQKQVLDLDFGNSAVLPDLVKRAPRQQRATKVLIAPWTHYWTGYFDYIFFIALKICRIKEQLSADEFADALVCYPLFNASFEQEILALLGVKQANLIDSRHTEIVFDSCLIGNNDSWFYPNKQDVLAFSRLVQRTIKETKALNTRLYIQRTGRRRILNEAELLALLARYDFIVIADVPRSYADQIALYYNASFIIGPHGASFANILGCRAGTQLFELFADAYIPGYFRYLAQLLDLHYAAYCAGQPSGSEHSHVADDIIVDVTELEQQLTSLLTP